MDNKKKKFVIIIGIGVVLLVVGIILLLAFNEKEPEVVEPPKVDDEEEKKESMIVEHEKEGIVLEDFQVKEIDATNNITFKVTNNKKNTAEGISVRIFLLKEDGTLYNSLAFYLGDFKAGESREFVFPTSYDWDLVYDYEFFLIE